MCLWCVCLYVYIHTHSTCPMCHCKINKIWLFCTVDKTNLVLCLIITPILSVKTKLVVVFLFFIFFNFLYAAWVRLTIQKTEEKKELW